MVSKEKLDRINVLANKAKTEHGLDAAEIKEQQELRQEYLQSFRGQFTDHLHSVKIIDPNGDDVTPKKLKDSKENRKKQS
ncbi:UPF0291 protein YnzC [Erysipelotrichaceae bacterium]|nr:UPF0291 protein YnzC [Erysipelotrichaceae bacterium]